MKRFALTFALALCLLPGCRRGLEKDVDPDEGGRALQTALEAWKSGKSPEELEKGTPSIIMNEDAWRSGKRLLDFKVEESSMMGRQLRCRVGIKLADKDGKALEQKATYVVDTIPRIVIVRDTFAS